MKAIKGDAQNLVKYHAVKSAKPELCTKLEKVIKDIECFESSILSENDGDMIFYSTDVGTRIIHTGR